jgi:hypothetical protein
MKIFTEKIDPPPVVPLTNEQLIKLRLEAMKSDEIWVKKFIDRLVGVIREVKH